MKSTNFIRILDILIVFCAIHSNAQECYWSSHAGGSSSDFAGVMGSDRLGNTFISGTTDSHYCYFNSDTLICGGNNLAFIVKYDPEGNEVWVKRFDGAGTSQGESVSVGGIIDTIRNEIIAYGSFYGHLAISDTNLYGDGKTIFLLKMDLDGNLIWARTAGGGGGPDIWYYK